MKPTDTNLFSPGRVLTVLGILLAILFWRVLFAGETFFYRDFGAMGLPGAHYQRTAILEGAFPLWNPYSNCGAPFLAQWGTMVLYPLSLIYVVLPFPWSLNAFCLLHLWLGAAGMYFVARRWTQSDAAATAGAAAYLFNGVALSSLTWPNYTVAVGLFPWVVWSAERAWGAANARSIALAAIISAAQLLAGVPELSLFTWILVGALWILRLAQSPGKGSIFAAQFAIVAGATGLVSAQLLPFWEQLQISQRAPGFAAEKWALPPWGWANLVLPQFHAFKTPEGTTFQYGQEFLSSTYLGVPLLALAVAGLLFARDPRRWILAGIGIVAAVLALGSAGHVLPTLKSIFPLIGIGRYPVKFLFLVMFAATLLAALGWRAIAEMDAKIRARYLSIAAAAASLVFAGLYWFNVQYPFPYDRLGELKNYTLFRWVFAMAFLAAAARAAQQPAWLVTLLALAAADSSTHLQRQNPSVASALFAPLDWAATHKVAKPQFGEGRAFITPEAEARLLHSSATDPLQDVAGKRLAEWSHLNLIDRVPKINGSSTLQVGEQAAVQSAIYSGTNVNREDWLDFLGATLQTSSNSVVEWSNRPGGRSLATVGRKTVGAPEVSISIATNLSELVWIENQSFETLAQPAQATISSLKASEHRVSFTVESDRETYAVIAQSWHPAWQAEVNGAPAAILKANVAFQAVKVPAGKSEVTMRYRDRSFQLGSAISLGTLAIIGIAIVRTPRKSTVEKI